VSLFHERSFTGPDCRFLTTASSSLNYRRTRIISPMRRALLLFPLILVPVALAGAKPPHLALPYGLLVDHNGRIFIADAGRHQVLRYDAQRQCLVRVAGNGKAGIDGDGGPAVRARLGEITSLAEDSTGQLYISDVHNGVVRRFVPGGRIATVAHVPGAVGIDIDPGGRYLAIASIERGVMRLNLSTGGLETVVPIGEGVDGPHGLRYDARATSGLPTRGVE
jgi:sugar lactone lactonase YvrE